jgi:hypothetical protein
MAQRAGRIAPNQSLRPTAHLKSTRACLPTTPAVAYLFFVRPMRVKRLLLIIAGACQPVAYSNEESSSDLTSPYGLGMFVSEDFLQWFVEDRSNSKCQLQRRGVFLAFDRHDGLPGYTDLLSQLLLRHFIELKAQSPETINYLGLSHDQLPRR